MDGYATLMSREKKSTDGVLSLNSFTSQIHNATLKHSCLNFAKDDFCCRLNVVTVLF